MAEIYEGDAKEFKVGDEVTVVGNDCDANKSHIGEQGKVVAIFSSHPYYPFEVLLDSGDRIEFSAKELELTKKPMTPEEIIKAIIDGTKKMRVVTWSPKVYVVFDNGFKYNEVGACDINAWIRQDWEELIEPPKFQPKQFVVNSVGDIGIIAGNIGHRGNIPLYDVRFNGTTAKTTPVLETELSEVAL